MLFASLKIFCSVNTWIVTDCAGSLNFGMQSKDKTAFDCCLHIVKGFVEGTRNLCCLLYKVIVFYFLKTVRNLLC